MSNNKQSSVESLFEKLWDTPKDKFTWYAILEEHKTMHKEEIVTTWHKGYDNLSPMIDEENCGDKHYQKTFNQQQND
jgi:hypothetical protein